MVVQNFTFVDFLGASLVLEFRVCLYRRRGETVVQMETLLHEITGQNILKTHTLFVGILLHSSKG